MASVLIPVCKHFRYYVWSNLALAYYNVVTSLQRLLSVHLKVHWYLRGMHSAYIFLLNCVCVLLNFRSSDSEIFQCYCWLCPESWLSARLFSSTTSSYNNGMPGSRPLSLLRVRRCFIRSILFLL